MYLLDLLCFEYLRWINKYCFVAETKTLWQKWGVELLIEFFCSIWKVFDEMKWENEFRKKPVVSIRRFNARCLQSAISYRSTKFLWRLWFSKNIFWISYGDSESIKIFKNYFLPFLVFNYYLIAFFEVSGPLNIFLNYFHTFRCTQN